MYTANTRTIEKAANWLVRYMGCSKAERLYELTHAKIEEAAAATTKDDERLEVSGENWNCLIEKMEKGKFKVSMDWAADIEPIEYPVKKRSKKKLAEAPAEETTKTEEATQTEEASAKKNMKKAA